MSHDRHDIHIVGYSTHVMVWLSLIILTSLTVAAAGVNFGTMSVVIALVIATIKASLVLAYFMHLKYEKAVFLYMLVLALVTYAIFIGLTFFDLPSLRSDIVV